MIGDALIDYQSAQLNKSRFWAVCVPGMKIPFLQTWTYCLI